MRYKSFHTAIIKENDKAERVSKWMIKKADFVVWVNMNYPNHEIVALFTVGN